ncbi:hypothetical protein CspHIS471_0203580 [Cutaneotrichosporon sp. HIS471]|nr:hypothetical protein CspHIS471_0203580 [Cutaneotrichosporon sp. HIS471]
MSTQSNIGPAAVDVFTVENLYKVLDLCVLATAGIYRALNASDINRAWRILVEMNPTPIRRRVRAMLRDSQQNADDLRTVLHVFDHLHRLHRRLRRDMLAFMLATSTHPPARFTSQQELMEAIMQP